jgi:hypothetical protein
MAANGISTHLPKSERRELKLQLAKTKRQSVGTNGFRILNQYTSPGTTIPTIGRPWST